MIRNLVWVSLAITLLLVDQVAASGKIAWGSRAGMTVTVVHMSGLNTANAIIRTKHAPDDALTFCRDYVRKITKQCIQGQLEIPLNDVIEGNCVSGEFTDFQGTRFRFLGEAKKKAEFSSARYEIQEISSGEIADGSSASGYPVLIGIYRALCPRKAPFPGHEYWSMNINVPVTTSATVHKLPFLDGVYASDEKICAMNGDQLAKTYGDQLGNVRKVLKGHQVTWGWEVECKIEKAERSQQTLNVVFSCDSEGVPNKLREIITVVSNRAFLASSRSFVRCAQNSVTTIRLINPK